MGMGRPRPAPTLLPNAVLFLQGPASPMNPAACPVSPHHTRLCRTQPTLPPPPPPPRPPALSLPHGLVPPPSPRHSPEWCPSPCNGMLRRHRAGWPRHQSSARQKPLRAATSAPTQSPRLAPLPPPHAPPQNENTPAHHSLQPPTDPLAVHDTARCEGTRVMVGVGGGGRDRGGRRGRGGTTTTAGPCMSRP